MRTKRFGFHYDHPLRYELAERLARDHASEEHYRDSATRSREPRRQNPPCISHSATRSDVLSSRSARRSTAKGLEYKDCSVPTMVIKRRYLEAWTGGVIHAPYPYSEEIPAGMTEEQYVDYCLWYLDNHIPNSIAPRDGIAAVMIEPGLGGRRQLDTFRGLSCKGIRAALRQERLADDCRRGPDWNGPHGQRCGRWSTTMSCRTFSSSARTFQVVLRHALVSPRKRRSTWQ